MTSPNLSETDRERAAHISTLCAASTKYLLPDGGLVIDDFMFKALDDTPLRLPQPIIALEYQPLNADRQNAGTNGVVIFAVETDEGIDCFHARRFAVDGVWGFAKRVRIPYTGYIDRSVPPDAQGLTMVFECSAGEMDLAAMTASRILSFLNILSCMNVAVEKSAPKKAGKTKSALPFDTYHVLTIDVPFKPGSAFAGGGGSHRAPREHLRRGHIRKLPDNKRIWVNACVVNAGVGGKVSKDYAVRNRAPAAQPSA
jgi:hypothetical protein